MIKRIIEAILSAVAETGDHGVPDGHLYMMLQSILGADVWTIDVHTSVIANMVAVGALTNEHHLLRIGKPVPQLVNSGQRQYDAHQVRVATKGAATFARCTNLQGSAVDHSGARRCGRPIDDTTLTPREARDAELGLEQHIHQRGADGLRTAEVERDEARALAAEMKKEWHAAELHLGLRAERAEALAAMRGEALADYLEDDQRPPRCLHLGDTVSTGPSRIDKVVASFAALPPRVRAPDPYQKAAKLIVNALSKKELCFLVSVLDGDCDDVVFSALVDEDRKNFPNLYTPTASTPLRRGEDL